MRNRIGRPRFNQGPASARGIESFSTATGTPFTPAGNIEATNVQDAIEELDAEKVAKAGDTMSGFLTLSAAPTSNLHAATKLYVDSSVAAVTHPESATAVATISDAAPVSPVVGQLWWESDTGYMFIYFDSTWVPVTTTPYVPSLVAPVLDLLTDATDLTPDFTLSGDLAEGDTIRFQYSTASDFTGTSELTHTIDAAEDAADAFSFATGELAEDTWYFRARVERVGYITSDWSNVESIEIIGTGASAEVSQFLDRTSGLDTTHVDAYTALIDGLVADAVWSKIDILFILATQDSTTMLQNLKSSLYTATLVGAPNFFADDGLQTPEGTYLKTGFNPTTASSPNYQQDSAHIGAWVYADDGSVPLGGSVGVEAGTVRQYILPNYSFSLTAYFRINTHGGLTASVANGAGWTLANRSGATDVQGYRNGGAPIATTTSDGSIAPNNTVFTCPDASTLSDGSVIKCAFSVGGSLTQTEENALYARLRTYMTAVGVP